MEAIQSIEQISQLIRKKERRWQRFGMVNASYEDDLVFLHYTTKANYRPPDEWNWLELNARGLVLDRRSGALLARPFAKFFNYDEKLVEKDEKIVEVQEKLDGSLGIAFWRDGIGWTVATRRSAQSEQSRWATDFFRRNWNFSPKYATHTWMFEIIYPQNRVVVNYGDREDMVLLAARHTQNGEELTSAELRQVALENHIHMPKLYDLRDWQQLLEAASRLDDTLEGWVAFTNAGRRVKIKGGAYLITHRILTGATFGQVLKAVRYGYYDDVIKDVPEEYLTQVTAWRQEIEEIRVCYRDWIDETMASAPDLDNKAWSAWAIQNFGKSATWLFAAKEGWDLDEQIYKNAFEDR